MNDVERIVKEALEGKLHTPEVVKTASVTPQANNIASKFLYKVAALLRESEKEQPLDINRNLRKMASVGFDVELLRHLAGL